MRIRHPAANCAEGRSWNWTIKESASRKNPAPGRAGFSDLLAFGGYSEAMPVGHGTPSLSNQTKVATK
jgi:hypothetical protein